MIELLYYLNWFLTKELKRYGFIDFTKLMQKYELANMNSASFVYLFET